MSQSEKGVSSIAPPRGPADIGLGGISMVFPVYNESFIIEQTLRNYIAELQDRVPDLEVIVAEDGSTDDTKSVLERLALELPIKLYSSNERKGYQRAVIDAIAHATKPWIFIVDSDYQFAAIDFWRLEPHRRTHDIILGIKSPRKDPFHRVFLSWGYNLLMRQAFKVDYVDMDTGFRLIRKSVADEISPEIRHMSFFTAEFVVRSHFAGHKILQVPVRHYARKIGSTTIFFMSQLFVICFRQYAGLHRLKQELKHKGLKSPVKAQCSSPASGTAENLVPAAKPSTRPTTSQSAHYNVVFTVFRSFSMQTYAAFRLAKIAEASFPTAFGYFRIFGFEGHFADYVEEAVVLRMGDLNPLDGSPAPLVRVHSQCLTGDVFHSLRCDCCGQLELAIESIAAEGRGLLIYEHQEGRGIGLLNKLRAYELQDHGLDTIEANEKLGFASDLRSYTLPAQIVLYFGLSEIRLMSNNPEKVEAMERAGVKVVERVPCLVPPLETREDYLRTKKERMGHLLG